MTFEKLETKKILSRGTLFRGAVHKQRWLLLIQKLKICVDHRLSPELLLSLTVYVVYGRRYGYFRIPIIVTIAQLESQNRKHTCDQSHVHFKNSVYVVGCGQLSLLAAILTKHKVMSYIAQTFNPLGLLGSFLHKGKAFHAVSMGGEAGQCSVSCQRKYPFPAKLRTIGNYWTLCYHFIRGSSSSSSDFSRKWFYSIFSPTHFPLQMDPIPLNARSRRWKIQSSSPGVAVKSYSAVYTSIHCQTRTLCGTFGNATLQDGRSIAED